MKTRLDILAVLIVTVLALVGIVVLAVLQLDIPDVLAYVVTGGAGALGMAANPLARSSADAQNGPTPPAPTPLIRTSTGKPLHPRKRVAK
ncbi:MAG: hypothetical protein HOV96_19605 [Nonomuraea sp.]|nr:hypothetical protein [Nonomuraea sp.]